MQSHSFIAEFEYLLIKINILPYFNFFYKSCKFCKNAKNAENEQKLWCEIFNGISVY